MPVRLTVRYRFAAVAVALLAAVFATVASALAPGDFDPEFGTGGTFVSPLGEGTRPGASISALALQPDGKIVVAGVASGNKIVVARLSTEGTLDPTFGTGGKFLTDLGAGTNEAPFVVTLALQADGKIVIGGHMGNFVTQENRFLVARVNANGSGLDSSFGTGGEVLTQLGAGINPYSSVLGVAVQPDGKILAAGGAKDGNGNGALLVTRLDAAGAFDPSFGTAGKVITELGLGTSPSSGAAALALTPDGKIFLGGFATDTNNPQPDAVLLARLNADGMSFDPSFDGDGKLVTRLGQSSPVITNLAALALQPDGRIVVGGVAIDAQSHHEILVGRVNTDGSLDSSFGTGGTVITQLGPGTFSQISGLAIQPDGKIVAVGDTGTGGVLVARLNADGTFDSSFATSGKVVTQLGPASSYFRAVVLEPDAKVVAGGSVVDNTPDTHALVARLIVDLPPSVAFTAAPNPVKAGQPVAFSGSGSDPDGTVASYSWDFGDGATASGPSVMHSYASASAYNARLTVRDNYGLSATSIQTIVVNPATTTNPVKRAAVLSRLSISPRAFAAAARAKGLARRTGAVISYRDTLAATTTFTVARALPGRKSGRRCLKPTARNRQGKRCTRLVRVRGSFSHRDSVGANRVGFAGRLRGRALAPGSYRLSATPRTAGTTGHIVATSFRIIR